MCSEVIANRDASRFDRRSWVQAAGTRRRRVQVRCETRQSNLRQRRPTFRSAAACWQPLGLGQCYCATPPRQPASAAPLGSGRVRRTGSATACYFALGKGGADEP